MVNSCFGFEENKHVVKLLAKMSQRIDGSFRILETRFPSVHCRVHLVITHEGGHVAFSANCSLTKFYQFPDQF